MMLFAHRPDARAPRCAARRADDDPARAALRGRDRAARRRPVRRVGGSRPSRRLRDLIVARAGGNPLFVEEIVRSLAERGVLVRDGDRWACGATRARR